MLCLHSPNLKRYYKPGRECVTSETLEDFAEKACWYLAHEAKRVRIARRYLERTSRGHMCDHCFGDLFGLLGFDGWGVMCSAAG